MDLRKTDNINFFLKIFIIILSFLTPFILLFFNGKLNSISAYWDTPLQPLFILTNALTTYIFIDLPKWRLSGILLFGLTIFSVEYHPTLHNVIAILFFIVNIIPLYHIKRYRFILLPYILSCIWLPDLFWFEVQAITFLCLYHLNLLIRVYKVIN
jgi:hypothetical protein